MTNGITVVIPATRSRLDEVEDCIRFMGPAGEIIVVTNPPDAIKQDDLFGVAQVVTYPSTEVNISKWWNHGQHYAQRGNDILYLESDVRMSWNWVLQLQDALDATNCTLAGVDRCRAVPHGYETQRGLGPWDLTHRPSGVALLARGQMMHDERLTMWFADDDFIWQHRVTFGAVLVGHGFRDADEFSHPDGGEPASAIADAARFTDKWGRPAW